MYVKFRIEIPSDCREKDAKNLCGILSFHTTVVFTELTEAANVSGGVADGTCLRHIGLKPNVVFDHTIIPFRF